MAQVPNNSSLVLVPYPKLEVHLQRVFGEIYITPLALLCIPFDYASQLNHPVGDSSGVRILCLVFFDTILG